MLKQITISIIPLITLLVVASCGSFPAVEPVEVCAINVSGDYCRCASFDFNYGRLEAITESENFPLDHCQKFIALSPKGWVDVIHYLDSIYVWKDKNFRSKKVRRFKRRVPKDKTVLGLLNE